MLTMPVLDSERIRIRPFVPEDLAAASYVLDGELAGAEGEQVLAERERWLQWTTLSYEALARQYQPPYGDRAIVLRASGELIGACGYTPSLAPFGQLPTLSTGDAAADGLFTAEVGLYYAVSPRFRRQGYASEAAQSKSTRTPILPGCRWSASC